MESKLNEIKGKLNYITILDFKENYDKSEIQRLISVESDEILKTKNEIKEILSSIYDTEKYYIRVSNNFVSIDEIINKTENSISTKEYKKIWSDNFSKLPYSWVMGRKTSKKAMENAIREMI